MDWSALFVRYQAMAVRFVQGIVGSADQAEDLVQDAFRSIFERSQRGELALESLEHARNYLFRALHNLAIDALRSPAQRASELPEGEELVSHRPGPVAGLEQAETRALRESLNQEVQDAMHTLKPKEEEVIRMRYGEGLRYREIAERTGTSVSTLQGRLEGALNKIRGKLGKRGGLS